jgi:hypothetical protein
MDYGTGKTLSLIALIFVILELVTAVIMGMLYLFQGIFFGAMVFSGGDSSTGALCMAVSVIFVLIIIAIPAIKMKWGLGIYKSFKNGTLSMGDKPILIALVVLSLLSGAWIPGVLYIVILASLKELQGKAFSSAPPPDHISDQQYPDELNW